MNMILHDNPTAEIWQDNTLASPHFLEKDGSLKLHDFAVANPPFSTKAWSNGFNPAEDLYGRFKGYGIPPAKNGDYAFLLHILRSLKSSGKGAVILPHGVLFRGNAEAEIRRSLVSRGVIKGIIGLPANLFYGTGIPACIIVLDKENAESRCGIFMIDASKGFVKDGNKNRLRHQDVHKIVDVFNKQIELPKYSRMVCRKEIERNDYNLNIPRYIDSSEPEDLQDLSAHLFGGIPNTDIEALVDYWQVFPTLRQELFEAAARPGYSRMKVESNAIKPTIFAHPEFTAYTQAMWDLFAGWQAANTPQLKGLAIGDHPKALIETLSGTTLQAFAQVRLIDPYDVYQHLMSYWTDTMQDDVYMIAVDGWQAIADGKPNTDLIPIPLIINRYFAAERDAIETLEAARDAISRQMEEMDEEHGGEEGLLAEGKNDKGKLTKVSINARLKEIKKDPEADDERKALEAYAALIEKEAAAGKKVREALLALHTKVVAQYGKLSADEIKTLVVDDKWMPTIAADVQSELDRVSQVLAERIKTLADRYASPMPQLTQEVETLSMRVAQHLKMMGLQT
jgi:type I restriction enzyme M protein